MILSDPIADMLTRIRNAHQAELDMVTVPHSRLKGEVLRVMKREGFITDYVVEGADRKKILRIYLKYGPNRDPAIRELVRESRPGLRKYVGAAEVPRVLGGLGTAILSTSAGVMSGEEARRAKTGGELICRVW